MKVRCPHCEFGIELIDDIRLDSVSCPSCGSHFSLASSPEDTVTLALELPSLRHFQFIELAGRGSFGYVWKARDEQLDRIVAVKVPHTEQQSDSEAELFLREARLAAHLDHPHIVTVLEVGRERGRTYIVSQFVEGITLRDWMKHYQPKPQQSAGMCSTIARALHYAHERGVVHRDLKPTNVLVDGEGQPHIADFGLAKRDVTEATIAVDGQILGTPAYMAPEQARGDATRADRRADIWALGIILYELLTGERPFRGTERVLLYQILHDEPQRPRHRDRRVPYDLETICLKALAKDPAQRYATAAELADDLDRFARHEPIRARRTPLPVRAWRWARRRPALAGLLLMAALVALLLPMALLGRGDAGPRRTVLLDTLPSRAQVVFIPLDEHTSRPDFGRSIQAGRSPVTARVPPGQYLVVAYQSDELFHEVYRYVPAEHEMRPGLYPHQHWRLDEDRVRLDPIQLHHQGDLQRQMSRVEGGEFEWHSFDGGRQRVVVPDFLVDSTEVTIGMLRQAKLSLPIEWQGQPPTDDMPATYVDWDQAVRNAERMGRRLLADAEFEYLATDAGRRRFPWGDEPSPPPHFWIVHPAGLPEEDRLESDRVEGTVFGLFSNALEWTDTVWAGRDHGPMQRIVRGGPGLTDADLMAAVDVTPQYRIVRFRSNRHARLGFRGARSARPTLSAQDALRFEPVRD